MSAKLPLPEIILASRSPRRSLLLTNAGIPFRVIIPSGIESTPENGEFCRTAMHNAEIKAREVIPQASGQAILGADTIVELDNLPLGKPRDSTEATEMLHRLSGREHRVYTGVALLDPPHNLRYVDYSVTRVTFRHLGIREIEAYVETGEPLDKAGAYGIQERGALLIDRIDGCFFNVMGLPVGKVWEMLKIWRADCGKPLADW